MGNVLWDDLNEVFRRGITLPFRQSRSLLVLHGYMRHRSVDIGRGEQAASIPVFGGNRFLGELAGVRGLEVSMDWHDGEHEIGDVLPLSGRLGLLERLHVVADQRHDRELPHRFARSGGLYRDRTLASSCVRYNMICSAGTNLDFCGDRTEVDPVGGILCLESIHTA